MADSDDDDDASFASADEDGIEDIVTDKLVVASEETKNKPALASEETKNKPAVASEETKSKPAVASEETKDKPTVVSEETDDSPAVASEKITIKPAIASEETKNKPAIGSEETKDKPVVGSKETTDKPAVGSKETKDKPDVGSEETKDKPTVVSKEKKVKSSSRDKVETKQEINKSDGTPTLTARTSAEHKSCEEDLNQVQEQNNDASKPVHDLAQDCCTADKVQEVQAAGGHTDEVTQRDPRSALERLTGSSETAEGGSGGGWGWSSLSSWGTSVISSASSSVGTFTNQIGSGLHQVLHTVEAGFDENVAEDEKDERPESLLSEGNDGSSGDEVITKQVDRVPLDVPSDPGAAAGPTAESGIEELPKEQQSGSKDDDSDSWFSGWGLSDIVHKTTNAVQQTTSASKKVVTGGLDVLETIGKKTFDILTEGDQGLRKVIEHNRNNKPNLSQSLREAKEEAERRAKEEEEFLESRRANFGAQFDDHQGLVQLEALEMLSSSSESQLKKLLGILTDEQMEGMKEDLVKVKNTFDNTSVNSDDSVSDAEWDFQKLILDYRGRLTLNISVQKLLSTDEEARSWLKEFRNIQKSDYPCNSKDIHHKAIECLAMLTAYTIEHFHRVSLLIMQDQSSATSSSTYHHLTTSLSDLTKTVCEDVSRLTAQFVKHTTDSSVENQDGQSSSCEEPIKEIVTNVYLESSNSCSYMHNAFQLLCPVIQLAVVKTHPLCKDLLDK